VSYNRKAVSALGKFELRYAGKSALTALRLHPTALIDLLRRWTSASTLDILLTSTRTRGEAANVKAHFKRIRSSRT